MKNLLKPIYHFSKSMWIIGLPVYISISLSVDHSLSNSGFETFNIVFMVISMILIFIEFLACFQPIPIRYDLSRVEKSIKPLKENFLSRPKTRRLLLIFESFSNIFIYAGILIVLFFPDKGLLAFLTLGLILKAVYYITIAFEPQNVDQDLGEIFPELKQ